jgi:hypothetical protein
MRRVNVSMPSGKDETRPVRPDSDRFFSGLKMSRISAQHARHQAAISPFDFQHAWKRCANAELFSVSRVDS